MSWRHLYRNGNGLITVCSLLGYERYNAMRADPDLCFLERVGMPDVTALSAEQGGGEGVPDIADRYTQTYTYCTHTQNVINEKRLNFLL